MRHPSEHLPRDLKVLRYLDALNAGELEAVADLWDEASHDPELELMLVELNDALFVENPTANADAGVKPILLPKRLPARRRRWAAWAGVGGALAAACVLAALAWSIRDSKPPEPGPVAVASAQQVRSPTPHDFVGIPERPEARRLVDGQEKLTFHWPLPVTPQGTLSTSIPPDLLD